jgi:hypothetical protein
MEANTKTVEIHTDGACPEHPEPAPVAIVAERAGAPVTILQQVRHRALVVELHAAVHAVVLERADHLEAGPVSDVRETGVCVAAEVALEDPAIRRAVHHGAPCFQLANPFGRLLRVQLRHAMIVQVLTATHGVREVDLPVVALVDVRESGGDAAFGHHRVRLAQQRLRDDRDRYVHRRRLDRGAQAGAAGADDDDVVFVRFVLRHQRILQSVKTPIDSMRT